MSHCLPENQSFASFKTRVCTHYCFIWVYVLGNSPRQLVFNHQLKFVKYIHSNLWSTDEWWMNSGTVWRRGTRSITIHQHEICLVVVLHITCYLCLLDPLLEVGSPLLSCWFVVQSIQCCWGYYFFFCVLWWVASRECYYLVFTILYDVFFVLSWQLNFKSPW